MSGKALARATCVPRLCRSSLPTPASLPPYRHAFLPPLHLRLAASPWPLPLQLPPTLGTVPRGAGRRSATTTTCSSRA
jgi:hypothetical protein